MVFDEVTLDPTNEAPAPSGVACRSPRVYHRETLRYTVLADPLPPNHMTWTRSTRSGHKQESQPVPHNTG
jgi:hypothetical protein